MMNLVNDDVELRTVATEVKGSTSASTRLK